MSNELPIDKIERCIGLIYNHSLSPYVPTNPATLQLQALLDENKKLILLLRQWLSECSGGHAQLVYDTKHQLGDIVEYYTPSEETNNGQL